MRLPNPIANNPTEAYLAYKAGVLEVGDLKPSLYDPDFHFDAWLAYWTGLVNTYPTNANGDPECLTDEEALVAYLSGVTDTYPEEIKDPYDVRIVGYLKYLVSIRWGRPDYPVNNSELYLSMMSAPIIPSGDPSSDIVIDNTAEAPFASLQVYGDTFQQTYSGKNLLPVPDSRTTTHATLTNNGDGTFNVVADGAQTGSIEFSVIVPLADSGIVGGQKYTISSNKTIGQNSGELDYFVHSVDSNGTWKKTLIGFDSAGTKTAGEPSTEYIKFIVRVRKETVINLTNVKTQIEAGESETAWQPYTAGPSPNPDYPQAINVVTGEQTVKVTGKNLCDFANATQTASYLSTYTKTNTTVAVESTSANGYAGVSYNIYNCVSGKTYTVSMKATVPTTTGAVPNVRLGRNNNNVPNIIGSATSVLDDGHYSIAYTFTADSDFALNISFYPNYLVVTTAKTVFYDIQIEENNQPTPYEPYQSTTKKVNLTGKNLFDTYGDVSYSYGLVSGTVTNNMDGTITTTANGGSRRGLGQLIKNVIPGQKYTLGATFYSTTSTQNTKGYIQILVGGTTTLIGSISFGVSTGIPGVRTTTTVTIPDGVTDVWLSFMSNGSDVQTTYSDIQFELGETATAYAPYYNYELCEIGNYQDYIYKSGDDWYVHKVIGKFTANGTYGGYNSSRNWFYNSPISYSEGEAIAGVIPMSEDFTGYSFSTFLANSSLNGIAVGNEASNPAILIRNTTYSSADAYKTWLGNLQPTFYYGLATPTDTKITDATLIGELEAILEGGSYQGRTYIKVTATDPNLPALLKVEAYKYD